MSLETQIKILTVCLGAVSILLIIVSALPVQSEINHKSPASPHPWSEAPMYDYISEENQ